MRIMKAIVALAIVFAMAIPLPAFATFDIKTNVSQIVGNGNTVVFIDVPANYWAKEQIDYFTQQGIVSGYNDGSFKPNEGVTREEFCKLLVSTFSPAMTTPTTPSFSDVATDRWSYPYVEACSEFLTGYANPFGGLPSFHPKEYATREDIAVALVRMMGFSEDDARDKNYAKWKFYDGSSISPGVLAYVSIACEQGLISGYPDGSFGPSRGITRAETVVLLNRATKQALTDINAELDLSAQVIYSADGKTATINVTAETGTTVTVNGEAVKMSNNYYDEYEGSYIYTFEKEGSKEFVIEGKKAGKSRKITVSAKYEIGVPKITITSCPTSVTTKEVTIKGTATDDNYSVSLTINGESVDVSSYYGSWQKTFTLKEGKNTFTFVATNEVGKTTTETRTINYSVGGPSLKITSCPTSVTTKEVTIKGTATDDNYSVSLTINGESVDLSSYYGSWQKTFTLKEGKNTFTFVATNEVGKTTTETRTINYSVGGPSLKITTCPTSVTTKEVTIKGTATDDNYSVSLTINGESVDLSSYYGSWEKTVTLKEGENTFTFVATNEIGKTTTETRTISLSIGSPELLFINCPETVSKSEITIRGRVTGENSDAILYINDEECYVNYSGEFSKEVNLNEGSNTFRFRAVNGYGKEVTEVRTIEYHEETEE